MVVPKVKGRWDQVGPIAPDKVENHWRVFSGAVTRSDVLEQNCWLPSEELLEREGRWKKGEAGKPARRRLL